LLRRHWRGGGEVTMSKVWLFQDRKQVFKLGNKCPWSVGYYDPSGRRRSKRVGSRSMTEKVARRLEGELAAGTYRGQSRATWEQFRKRYEDQIVPGMAVKTRRLVKATLDHFARIVKPAKLATIGTETIDAFVARRRVEPGKKPTSVLSAATVNRDLRHLKAALRVAHDWSMLPVVPKFRRLREESRIGRVMTPEHFQAIFEACDAATMPRLPNCTPGDWWRGLVTFALTTGWRIGEILALRRDDFDPHTGAILTRAADNKGGRDDADHLPAVALELVKVLVGFDALVFAWPHDEKMIRVEFHRVQRAAGIDMPCPDAGRHTCNHTCHVYGFHALRRGYATLNADSLPAPVLQRKMRYRSFTTTLRYIGLADKMKRAAEKVYVPEFLARRAAQ